MTNIRIILILLLISTISIGLIIFSGSEKNNTYASVPSENNNEEKGSCCASGHDDIAAAEFTANSIYQVNSKWTNQFGNEISIGDLRGKAQVFSMIFANCTYACPIIANDMRRIEKSLTKEELRNLQFTLVSIDPDRDDPERLLKFAKDQTLNLSYFQLLTGNRSDIEDLAALTGFRYKKENDGSFSHSNIITILNEEGEIIHQQTGLNQDITKTIEVIKNLNHKGA